jgi:DnaJ-domain-containing protein 1
MNPFEFFGIPESILPDQKLIRQKYLSIQMGEHPDFGSDGQLSEKANEYYAILMSDILRVKCLLQINGTVNINENILNSDFLMEMMEISDEIEIGKSGNETSLNLAIKSINKQLEALKQELVEIDQRVKDNNWSINNFSSELIGSLNSWFQRFKYLSRLEKNANGIQEI